MQFHDHDLKYNICFVLFLRCNFSFFFAINFNSFNITLNNFIIIHNFFFFYNQIIEHLYFHCFKNWNYIFKTFDLIRLLWCLFERLHVTKNKKLCFRRTPWGFSISVSYVTFMIRYWLPSDILFTSDTCRMSCHTSCHTHVTRLVTRFCLLTSATYRMSCHTIVLQVIYLKLYRFKRAFCTLRYFFKLFPAFS